MLSMIATSTDTEKREHMEGVADRHCEELAGGELRQTIYCGICPQLLGSLV